MITNVKYLLLLFSFTLIGCRSNNSIEKRSEKDDAFIEALIYRHDFKVQAQINNFKSKGEVDRKIVTNRASSGINKWTPLCFASFIGNHNAVNQLIKIGANIHFKDLNGQSPIILAAIAGNTEVITVLLKHGANINDMDNNNSTPLIHAASQGNIETVKLLVRSKALFKPEKKHSALDFALFHNRKEVAEYLKKVESDQLKNTHEGDQ